MENKIPEFGNKNDIDRRGPEKARRAKGRRGRPSIWCSKCGIRTRRPGQRYCSECHKKMMRKYRARDREERKNEGL